MAYRLKKKYSSTTYRWLRYRTFWFIGAVIFTVVLICLRREEYEPNRLYQGVNNNIYDPFLVNLSVLWLGPFKSGSGYGEESLNLLESVASKLPLLKAAYFGDKVYNRALNLFSSETLNFFQAIEPSCDELPSYFCDQTSDIVDIHCHCNETGTRKMFDIVVIHSVPQGWVPSMTENGVYKIGRTVFESDRLPPDWVEPINGNVDELWVPSRFNVEGFRKSGVKVPVKAIPQNMQFPSLNAASRRRKINHRFGCKKEDFVFLSIFAWNERKGAKYLLEAYASEFTQHENVCLLLLTRSYSGSSTLAKQNRTISNNLQQYRRLDYPRFHAVSQLSAEELSNIYLASDAFVLASRGEGWARPIMEAMFYEIPVIATNWSAHTEYLTEETGFPVQVEKLEKYSGNDPEMVPYVGMNLAVPSVTDLRRKMRQVIEDRNTVRSRVKKAKAHILSHYSRKAVEEEILRNFIAIKKLEMLHSS
eukprot:jgi/Galph1/5878/GphlegSOOS_G4444.1